MSPGRLVLAAALLAAACGGAADNPGDDDDAIDAGPVDGRVETDAGLDAVPDASPDAVVPTIDPATDGRLVINELMASNARTLPSESGPGLDWIELYNPTDVAIPLHGYGLTDDLALPTKAVLGANVVIPAHGRIVVWADDNPGAGPTHLGFQLASEGGTLGLARPDGSYIDRVQYGEQVTDLSAAREPDGSSLWKVEWLATPGAANTGTGGQPMGLEVVGDPPETIPAAGDVSETLLGYDSIAELALTIAPADIQALIAQPFEIVPAQITVAGRTYGPIGVRLKGQNSFQPITGKPSFRIKIDEYDDDARLFGLKDLTLNNMDDDLSMMHERLAYMIARAYGVAASRAAHTRVTVNGQAYGLYVNVETVKKKMLSRWFADDTGPLFEATDVDFAPQYIASYALESGPDDRSLLTGLANALALPDADAAIAAAADYVDLDGFLRFWAMCSIVAQFDSFPYSDPGDDYLVYADPTSRKLHFIPWGMDETFYSGQLHVANITHARLAARCKESPACFQTYVDHVWDLQAMTESMNLAGERVRVMAQIAPYIAADAKKPYSDTQVAESQQALYWFIGDRRLNLNNMLPPRRPTAETLVAPRALPASLLGVAVPALHRGPTPIPSSAATVAFSGASGRAPGSTSNGSVSPDDANGDRPWLSCSANHYRRFSR